MPNGIKCCHVEDGVDAIFVLEMPSACESVILYERSRFEFTGHESISIDLTSRQNSKEMLR
jgi:hypothetical protein